MINFSNEKELNYYNSLYSYIVGDDEARSSYKMLLEILYCTAFTWTEKFSFDANRASDGLILRSHYDLELADILRSKPCSILEMMVGLCQRCEITMLGITDQGHGSDLFWAMIINLELANYNDISFNLDEVKAILDRFLNRKYGKNGEGGLFRLATFETIGHFDMRKMEIWQQLQVYLNDLTGDIL